jgi:glutathione S-transferase
MKLYDSKRAPNPRRVRWVLIEKGVTDVEIIDVDILTGAHKTPDYLSRAKIPHVPALEMRSGDVITESLAICRYLESVYPEPNLFGRTPEETAVIEMWTRRAEMMLATPLMLLVRHTHPALAVLENQSAEIAQSNRTAAERSLKLFERALAETRFIAGDRITIADIVAFISFDFARMVRFAIPEEYPHLVRWAGEMRERPAYAGSVA